MSFVVGEGQNALSVNTLPCGNKLLVAGKEIGMEEFRRIVNYVMCNSELTQGEESDPRLELISDIKSLRQQVINGQTRLVGDREIPNHFSDW